MSCAASRSRGAQTTNANFSLRSCTAAKPTGEAACLEGGHVGRLISSCLWTVCPARLLQLPLALRVHPRVQAHHVCRLAVQGRHVAVAAVQRPGPVLAAGAAARRSRQLSRGQWAVGQDQAPAARRGQPCRPLLVSPQQRGHGRAAQQRWAGRCNVACACGIGPKAVAAGGCYAPGRSACCGPGHPCCACACPPSHQPPALTHPQCPARQTAWRS